MLLFSINVIGRQMLSQLDDALSIPTFAIITQVFVEEMTTRSLGERHS